MRFFSLHHLPHGRSQQLAGTAEAALRTLVRATEEEEMNLFAESKENLSIAHSSSTALPKLSGFPGGDRVSGCSVHHVSSYLRWSFSHLEPFQ